MNIEYLENNKFPNLNDVWLSGFTDVESIFYTKLLTHYKSLKSSMIILSYVVS